MVAPRGSFSEWALKQKQNKKKIYLALIEKRNIRHAAAIHCLTRREADQVRALVPEARCAVIPNAATIDPSPVADAHREALYARFPGLRGTRVVLFLSRIHQKKGLDLLVPAFARVAARVPDAHLVIAGPDEGGYRATVEGLVRDHRLEARVTFTGLVNGEEKRAVFQAAALFALPSYSEGLPVVGLEALAMGLPVAITRECNIDEEVLEAGAGVIVDHTVESVADAIERLLADRDAARAMGEAGRRLARERFSPAGVTGQMVALFERLREERR